MQLLARIVLIVGVGLSIFSGFELYLLSRGTSEPQPITVTELGKKGPLANTHVTISNFHAAENYVVESEDGRWNRVWVPLLTPDDKLTERPVMAYVTGVHNENELLAKIGREQLTGVVTNGMQNFGSKQQERVAPDYPGVDFSDAIALHIDRSFPNAIVIVPLLLLGVVLLLGGGGMTFGLIRFNRA